MKREEKEKSLNVEMNLGRSQARDMVHMYISW